MIPKNKPLQIKIFLIILLLLSTLLILKPLFYEYYPDFSSYYYATYALLNGENPYIVQADAFGPFIYPPTSLLLFLPFTLFQYIVAQKIFIILSILSFLFSITILLKLFKITAFSNLGMLLIILSFNFFPAKFTLGMGQINNFLLLALVFFVYYFIKKKPVLAGISLALAIMIKISPIILIAFLIIRKDWKILFSVFMTLIFLTLITDLFIGHQVLVYFFNTTLPDLLKAAPADYYNQSITGFLARSILDPYFRNIIRLIMSVFLTLLSLFIIWKNYKNYFQYSILCISVLITLGLIISGVSWQHHFVWLLLPIYFTYIYIKDKSLSKKYYFVLILSYLLTALNIKNPISWSIFAQSHVFYGAIILYLLNLHFLMKIGKKTLSKSYKPRF